jgi:hypothetical protein
MKHLLYVSLMALTLAACKSSKNYLERSNEDKALQDAVKRLNKNSSDDNALTAVPILYKSIKQARLSKISVYKNEKDPDRWDKIISEYVALQNAYEAIVNSTPAFRLVTPVSYSTELLDAKQSAAEEFYVLGNNYLSRDGRNNVKKAYAYFRKSDKYVPGYKNAQAMMKEAFEKAVVDVVINPVQDNSFFFNSGWGNAGYNYSNEYFQQTLVRDLGGTDNSRYPARFYTEWQARRDNIKPDWVVDLRLRNLDIPYPTSYNYRRNASAQVQVGTDTSGRPLYNTVYATVNITRLSFIARADMEVNIKDLTTGRNINNNSYREDYRWEEERGTYTGDSRALSTRDWDLVNNYGYNTPSKEQVLNELYRKIYPQVKNNITYAVDW